MKRVAKVMLLSAGFALATGPARADDMIITYRSGKVQTIRLDESSSRIASIGYQEEHVSSTGHLSPPSTDGPGRGAAAAPVRERPDVPQQGGSSVRIEWAQPLE